MVTTSPEFPKKILQIKQQDHEKFSSRKVSKENSMANPSFRVYYGGVTGAIPFTWEIQPGTPKHNFSDSSLPPLTPPPSYYHHDKPPSSTTTKKNSSRSKLFNIFFLKISLKKPSAGHVSSSHSQSFSSSWLSSSSSSRTSSAGSRRRFLSFGSSFDHDGMDDGHVYVGSSSPTSVYCFGSRRMMIRI